MREYVRPFIEHGSYAFIILGIHYLISWISTPALRQKLRIGQTSTVDYNSAFGMGLDPKLTAWDPNLASNRGPSVVESREQEQKRKAKHAQNNDTTAKRERRKQHKGEFLMHRREKVQK